MNRKFKNLFMRVMAWIVIAVLALGELPGNLGSLVVYAAEGRKVDVWDFGGVEESNTDLYINNITTNVWDSCTNVGTDGKFSVTGTTVFGDLTLTHNANDRLYSTSNKNYGSNALATTAFADGYTANGMYYCNGTGGENRRNITISNVKAGDVIAVYAAASNKTSDNIHFVYLGSKGTQDDTNTFSGTADKYQFVAQFDGSYKIYFETTNGAKPIVNRVVRIPGVEVTGTIDFADFAGECVVKFLNKTTGVETVASVDGNNYSVVLAAGYDYTAVMSGATGFGFTNDSKSFSTSLDEVLAGKQGVNLVVETKSIYNFTGNITGFAEDYDISNISLEMVPPSDTSCDVVKVDIAADLSFSAALQPDIEYSMVLSGVNDYEITSNTTLSSSEDVAADIVVALKAKYNVTGNFTGLENGAVVSELSFVNVEDNYVYKAEITENDYSVSLRAGAYRAQATVADYTTTTHVVVSGAATKDLMFVYTGSIAELPLVQDLYVGYSDKENNYSTVTAAVNAAKAMSPASEAERITIHIAPGTYREQIKVDVPYVTFKNDEAGKEVILTWYYGIGYKYYSADTTGYYNEANAYDKYDKNAVSSWGSATYVSKNAVGFRAENITFEASFNRYITDEELADGVESDGSISFVRKYGADVTSKAATERAAALYVGADQTEFYNCTFLGSQDTLYTGGSNVHSYYKNCFIEGNTDYIFGDGNVVFDNCELSFYGYSSNSVGGYITAAKDEASLGFLFRNCVVTANDDLTVTSGYYGRPWGAGAKVLFVNTKLETADLIVPAGWTDMSGNSAASANFKEYNTTALDGNTVDVSSRVASTVVAENPASSVTDYFGTWVPSYYVAESENVEFATAPYLVDNGDINAPYPGHTLTVCYSLGTENDANDASVINWYRVNGTTETLVKTASATTDKKYLIASEDAGCAIKVEVIPTTVSGTAGATASYTMEATVREGYENPDASDIEIALGEGVNIFLAGDSTVKDYSSAGMYMSGKSQNEGSWGEFLQSFFAEDAVKIINYANGGRSTRNFINEGSLDKIADSISEGDYLFIQFGHNDCANGSGYLEDRYVPLGTPDDNGVYPTTEGSKVATPSSLVEKYGDTFYSYDCGGTFKWYLLQYINVAKEKGAIPVLVTPVSRMYYTSEGTIKAHHDSTDTTTGTLVTSDNAYVTAVEQLAEEQGVLLIDAFSLTKTMLENAYKADSSATNGTSVLGANVMAQGDKTHSNKLGGFITAAYIAQDIQNKGLNISVAVEMPEKVLGETTDGTTVFTVNSSNVLTAYDQNNSFSTISEYWTSEGQKLIDAIGEKSGEVDIPEEETEVETETESESNTETETETESESNTETETETGTESNTEAETESGTVNGTMWIVGDSTVCSFDDAYYYPRYGYGTQIGNYLDDCYTVNNMALSGRSSLSYLSEDNYRTLMSGIKAGDVLVIGFGHNDEKAEEARYTNPNGDYTTEGSFAYTLYENYIKPAKAAGAEVILCTPIVRRTTESTFSDSDLHITSTSTVNGVVYEGGNYSQAIIDLGNAVNVPVIDLTTLTKEYYLSIGAAETLYLHAWTSKSENSVDNTHLNIYGAKKVAYMMAQAIKETDTIVASHIELGAEPTKAADLVSNPNYVEVEYDNNLAQSELWEDYGIFKGTVFGTIGGATKINTTNFALGTDANGNMRIAALNNNGKIASTADGIAMYYYRVPVGKNFTLTATATINSMDFTSQTAFGLMARDDMYIDKNDTSILSDYVVAGTLGTGVNCFNRRSTKLTKGSALTTETLAAGGSYDLKIESNSDGYACTFGSETTQTGGYDFQLTSIDSEYVYVGMFVSRKADVSFSNIKLVIEGEDVTADIESPSEEETTVDEEPTSEEETSAEEVTTSEEETSTEEVTTSEEETSTEEESTSEEETSTEEETTEEAVIEEPINIDASIYSVNRIRIAWDAVDNADAYLVYGKVEGDSEFKLKATTKATDYIDSGLTAGKNYSYYVVAKSSEAVSENSEIITIKAGVTKPGNVKAEVTTAKKVKVSWTKSDNAEGYIVLRKAAGENKFTVKATLGANKTAWTDTTVKKGVKYTYQIVAFVENHVGTKVKSDVTNVTVTAGMTKIAKVTVTRAGKSKVKISWTKSTGANGYQIYRKTGTGKFKLIATVKAGVVAYVDKAASETANNIYRIYPYVNVGGKKVQGAFTASAAIKAGLAKVTNLKATSVKGGVNLKWNKVADAEGYIIKAKRPGQKTFKQIAVVTKLTYKDTKAATNKATSYRVFAYYTNAKGKKVLSPVSETVSAKAKVNKTSIFNIFD